MTCERQHKPEVTGGERSMSGWWELMEGSWDTDRSELKENVMMADARGGF